MKKNGEKKKENEKRRSVCFCVLKLETLFLLLSLMHNLHDGRRSSSDFDSADSVESEVIVVGIEVYHP